MLSGYHGRYQSCSIVVSVLSNIVLAAEDRENEQQPWLDILPENDTVNASIWAWPPPHLATYRMQIADRFSHVEYSKTQC